MIERLLASLYSAFDKDPHPHIVLRVRHPDGVAWRVADRVLSVSTEAGAPLAVIDLHGKKLGQVAEQLQGAGCQIVYLNPEFAQRAGDVLLDGRGRQSQSNGDALSAFSSVLWSLLDAFALELQAADDGVASALRQLYLGTAEGEFLEVWGDYFGLLRLAGESDEQYRVRIITETLRPRVTKLAIERAVRDSTGNDVELYEPWKNVFTLSESALSRGDHMADGTYWLHNVAQPISRHPIDWRRPLEIIERSRPAGTIIAPPLYRPVLHASSDITAGGSVKMGREELRSMYAYRTPAGRLNVMRLGDKEVPAKNYKASISQLTTMSNSDPLKNPHSMRAGMRTIRRANIVLSDGDAIGRMNAVFQRTYWIQPKDRPVLNSMRLSDYHGRIHQGMVDEIRTLLGISLAFEDFGGAVAYSGIEETRSTYLDMGLVTQQQGVGITATRATHDEFNKVMTPKWFLWGFGGAGSWDQEPPIGWDEDKQWGEGITQYPPQS